MKRRLLLAIEVVEFLARLKRRDREVLFKRMEQIAEFPERYADFAEFDASAGRDLDVHVVGDFSLSYWDDFADRHLKVMSVRLADRAR